MSPDSTTLKRCSKCGEWKLRDQFHKNRCAKDGLALWCKACRSKAGSEHRSLNRDAIRERKRQHYANNREVERERNHNRYIKNREVRLEYARQYRSDNRETIASKALEYRIEHREEARQRTSRWRAENREASLAGKRRYYAEHPDEERERRQRWRRNNPDAYRANLYRRRARKKGGGGSCTSADLAAIRAAQTDRQGRLICWRCGKPIKDTPHLDHWIPLSEGGVHAPGNLHYMHAKCNMTKHSKHPTEIGRLL